MFTFQRFWCLSGLEIHPRMLDVIASRRITGGLGKVVWSLGKRICVF